MDFIKNYFYNKKPMSEKEYTTAKVCFTIESIAANSAANIASGAYVVALLAYMGSSEVVSNFVSSFSLYAGFFVILAPYITTNLIHKKPFVYLCRVFNRLPIALAFLAPIIFGKTTAGIIWVAALALLGNVMAQLMSPAYNQWFMNCISDGSPTKFCGLKDGIVNITQIVTFFALSLLTKHFTGDREGAGYTVMAVIALALWGVEMLSLTYIKEPYIPQREKKKVNTFKLLAELVNFKSYRSFLPFTVVYNIAVNMSNSLIGVYRVQRIGMSLEMCSYLLMTDLIIRSVMCYVFGRMAAKTGERHVMAIGTIFIALHVGLHAVMNSDNMVAMIPFVALFGGVGYGAYGSASFVYLFKCLPKHNAGEYFACHNVISLGIGSVASLAATCFIGIANGFEVNLLGFVLSEMRIVILVSAVLMIICPAILMTEKIKKHKV